MSLSIPERESSINLPLILVEAELALLFQRHLEAQAQYRLVSTAEGDSSNADDLISGSSQERYIADMVIFDDELPPFVCSSVLIGSHGQLMSLWGTLCLLLK